MYMLDHEIVTSAYQAAKQGGHAFIVQGVPTNLRDRQAVAWVATTVLSPAWDSDGANILGISYSLPYEQGGGFTVVSFCDPATMYEDATSAEDPATLYEAGNDDPIAYFPLSDTPAMWEPTGVRVTFGYADSFTNIFSTVVFVNTRTGEFELGEM